MSLITPLSFVKKNLEGGDIYTFSFASKRPIGYKAGQHGVFFLPGFYRPHPFSLSSSPEEKYVTISTHVGSQSPFKKKLLSMKKGDKLFVLGPIMNFSLRTHAERHVFLAQGIGITPFRSILAHVHEAALPVTTTLIHVDGKEHTFKALTEAYATTSFYPTDPDQFREYVKQQNPNSAYYLSGSPRYVAATKELLAEHGVLSKDIITDSFWGY